MSHFQQRVQNLLETQQTVLNLALKAKYGNDFNFDVNEAYLKKRAKLYNNKPKIAWNKLVTMTNYKSQVIDE